VAAAAGRITAGLTREAPFRFTIDGEAVEAHPGETIATALLAARRLAARRTAHRGAPRGLFCAIGVCHDCRMIVDGRANVRTCLEPARPGITVETQVGFGPVEPPGTAGGAAADGTVAPGALEDHEVIVVGGGPAGVRAAVAAAEAGARVLLLDEAPRPGGQIYRQLPAEIRSGAGDPLGRARRKGDPLLAAVGRAAVAVRPGVEVWGVLPDRTVLVQQAGRAGALRAGALVLATGAYDRPAALPGWTLPGVITAGGVTALVKAQGVLPGRRVLLAGTGPLLLAAAAALVRGGARVVGIAEAAPRRRLAGLLRPGVATQALGLAAALWRVPLWARHGLLRIEGAERVEEAVVARVDAQWRPLAGTARSVRVDTIVLGYGLVPSPELAELAGCTLTYDPGRGGWVPAAEPARLMATSVPGVFVAGDGAGIGGAEVAAAEGQLAGLGAAAHTGHLGPAELATRAAPARRALARLAGFRSVLGDLLRPRPGLYALATDETIVCRCEEVAAGEIRAAIDEGARRVTEVRAVTRAGMGLCQGRLCVSGVVGLLERWGGVPPERAGRFPPRLPARPVGIPVLADPVLADPALDTLPAPAGGGTAR